MPKKSSQSKQKQPRQPHQSELDRLSKLLELEKQAAAKGFCLIAGVDEAGRGPLAGPVVAAACLFKAPHLFEGINDSKLLTPVRRSALFQALTSHRDIHFGIGITEVEKIDEINILQATLCAMRAAVLALPQRPDYLLVDGNVGFEIEGAEVETVIHGDRRSQLIAASSIIAKEHRDQLMCAYHKLYPEYGFDTHKGYGTQKHRQALEKFGPCPIHRKTFEPVKSLLCR